MMVCAFFYCGEKHNIKFIILTILSVEFSSGKDIQIIVQEISRTFSPCDTETPYPLHTNPLLPVHDNHVVFLNSKKCLSI